MLTLDPETEKMFQWMHPLCRRPEVAPWWAKTKDGQEALAAEEAHYLKKVLRWARTKDGRSALAAAEAGDAAALLWKLNHIKTRLRRVHNELSKIAGVLSPSMKQQISEDVALIQEAYGKIITRLAEIR